MWIMLQGWSGGFEEGTEEQFLEYIHAVKQFGVATFDRVLVDGRARAACAGYVYQKHRVVTVGHDPQHDAGNLLLPVDMLCW